MTAESLERWRPGGSCYAERMLFSDIKLTAGKETTTIEIKNSDLHLLRKAFSVYLDQAAESMGESLPQDPIYELQAKLEEIEVLWESQRKHERQTVLDAERRVEEKKKKKPQPRS